MLVVCRRMLRSCGGRHRCLMCLLLCDCQGVLALTVVVEVAVILVFLVGVTSVLVNVVVMAVVVQVVFWVPIAGMCCCGLDSYVLRSTLLGFLFRWSRGLLSRCAIVVLHRIVTSCLFLYTLMAVGSLPGVHQCILDVCAPLRLFAVHCGDS